jgi:hypothetical protein
MKILAPVLAGLFIAACSSHPVLPTSSDIKVSRDEPSSNCKSLGAIEGRSTKIKPTPEEVLEDLKEDAVRKGANFVKIETMGAHGGAIRGQGYFCN